MATLGIGVKKTIAVAEMTGSTIDFEIDTNIVLGGVHAQSTGLNGSNGKVEILGRAHPDLDYILEDEESSKSISSSTASVFVPYTHRGGTYVARFTKGTNSAGTVILSGKGKK